MINLLNRLAWTASIAISFVFLNLFSISGRYSYDDGEVVLLLFSAFLLGAIFKKIFLSKSFIISTLSGVSINAKAPLPVTNTVPMATVSDTLTKDEQRSIGSESSPFNDLYQKNDLSMSSTILKESIISATTPALKISNNKAASQEITDTDEINEVAQKPHEPNFIQKFFQENALAKIGGILLFLGVMFLLQLVYTAIGPIGKLIIGFAIGFIVFGVGVWLDKKGNTKESRILLGIAILINYLVILSGRYLISDAMSTSSIDQSILGEGLTLFFLILNTVFAVMVSLVYNAHSLLFFSFVVAYLNPFLIGAQPSDTPYTLVGYSLVVSIGAVILSHFYRQKFQNYSGGLLTTAFLGGNTLILLAPFNTTSGWLVKLAAMAFLSLLGIYAAYNNDQKQKMPQYFILSYLFFALLLGFGNSALGMALGNFEIMIGYILFLAMMLTASVFVFSQIAISGLFYLLFAPLAILISLVFTDVLHIGNIIFVLTGTAFLYLIIFARLAASLTAVMRYSFFAVLGLFIFLTSNFINVTQNNLHGLGEVGFIANMQAYGVIVTSFLFLISAYYFSSKKNMEYLYSLGTIFGIFMLLPVIAREGDLRLFSIISILALMFLNIASPFINNLLAQTHTRNLVIGLLAGVLFAVGELFYFFFGDANMSKFTLGLAFLGLAMFYLILGFVVFEKLRNRLQSSETNDNKALAKNVVFAFLGVSISLFSLSVAYVFSTSSEIVAVIWLFEASLLFYFYNKTKDAKVYFGGVILMMIGLIKLTILLSLIRAENYLALIPLSVIFISLIASLKFLAFEERPLRYLHDLGHVFGMLLIAGLLMRIIPSHHYGYNFFGLATLSLLLFTAYGLIYSAGLKTFWILSLIPVFIYHIMAVNSIFNHLAFEDMAYLKVLQYVTTFIFAVGVFVYKYLMSENKTSTNYNKSSLRIISVALSFYLFIITSIYIYDLFDNNSFVVTIYWSIRAFISLSHGIKHDLIKFRTIGLYILSLTIGKILLYDVWSGLDNAVMRVFALMLVGGLMIAISLLYTKKYGGHLKGEFNLDNLKGKD